MSEIEQDESRQPAKRAQFPLWFLLFVLPTIAGLGIAIYTNWHEQARTRADLIAQRAVLLERVATLESEIALVEQISRQIQQRADRWKSTEAVVDYLTRYNQLEGRSGDESISAWDESRCFFVQADEQKLHRLMKRIQEEYPKGDVSNQFLLLDFAVRIPQFSPDYTAALAEDARQLAEMVPSDGDPLLKKQSIRLREAFGLPVSPVEYGDAP
ncbi:hypothetical protein Pan97_02080 [Bremerella volcania]|uniref:Uncharacterized protein n=1 Tax=Bremerella volcania TaxID=2527984 RepID=A0A518C1Y1_9BACT|nr:hypothetical protein [Bremerella volcania]QDU73241.1 hypothetical protein Pan97_02080 [Bremerella volcania]